MSDIDPEVLDDLPAPVAHRAKELSTYGFPLAEAIGRATVRVIPQDAEWTIDSVAETVGVDAETLRQYAADADARVRTAHRLVVAEYGGPTHILAEQSLYGRTGSRFIVADVDGQSGITYDDAITGEYGVRLIHVEAGGPSGELAGNMSVTSESFHSLDALAEEKYRANQSSDFESLTAWRSLLVDAGVDEDTLDSPGSKLPPGHPDSDDHVQYQMRSVEPPEQRGREHNDMV